MTKAWPAVSSCWNKAQRSQESSSIGSIVCPLLEMLLVTFWVGSYCWDASPLFLTSFPIMAFHNQFCELTQYFREISSQDKFTELKFQFFLRALIGIVGKLVTARVVN